MKYLVLVKQVPALSQLAFDPATRTLKREGVRLEVSSFDVRAVLRAVELRMQTGGEVVVLTMGPPQARDALVYCLGLGADRGIQLVDPAFAGADTLATARALARALEREGFDLVLCGRASVDAETGQVGPEVAELLALPQITCARTLEFDPSGKHVRVERETDAGFEMVACALPALVTAGEDLAPERCPRRADREAAEAKPITVMTARELSEDLTLFGLAGSPTRVEAIETIEETREGRIITGDSEVAVAELVRLLAERGLFARSGTVVGKTGVSHGLPENARRVTTARDGVAPERAALERGKSIWVVAETLSGAIRRVTLELLGKAAALSATSGAEVVAVLLGYDVCRHAERLSSHGADRVIVADDSRLGDYATDAYATVLARLIAERRPTSVLVPATYVGRDLAPRVAARLGLGLTGDCIDLSLDAEGRLLQWKPAFGGNVVAPILSRTRPEMATVRPGVLPPPGPVTGRTPSVERISVGELPPVRVQVIERRPIAGIERAAALDEAEVAIGVGVGIGGPEALAEIEALSHALGGAAIAATRDVTDKGWLPRQHQVGLTGRAIAPRFYFAIGIRGAFEHMVGLRRAGTIIAINRSPTAPIFKKADLGLVADWSAALRPLIEEIARYRSA